MWRLPQRMCNWRRKQVALVRAPPKALLVCQQAEEEYEEEMRLPATDSVGGGAHSCRQRLPLGCCIFRMYFVVCVECHVGIQILGAQMSVRLSQYCWCALEKRRKNRRHTTPPPTLSVEERTVAGGGGPHQRAPSRVDETRIRTWL